MSADFETASDILFWFFRPHETYFDDKNCAAFLSMLKDEGFFNIKGSKIVAVDEDWKKFFFSRHLKTICIKTDLNDMIFISEKLPSWNILRWRQDIEKQNPGANVLFAWFTKKTLPKFPKKVIEMQMQARSDKWFTKIYGLAGLVLDLLNSLTSECDKWKARDDCDSKIETLSDEELFGASDKLIEKNLEAYKELAK